MKHGRVDEEDRRIGKPFTRPGSAMHARMNRHIGAVVIRRQRRIEAERVFKRRNQRNFLNRAKLLSFAAAWMMASVSLKEAIAFLLWLCQNLCNLYLLMILAAV